MTHPFKDKNLTRVILCYANMKTRWSLRAASRNFRDAVEQISAHDLCDYPHKEYAVVGYIVEMKAPLPAIYKHYVLTFRIKPIKKFSEYGSLSRSAYEITRQSESFCHCCGKYLANSKQLLFY